MKSILDKSFRYTPSAETDLKKTFARIRKRQRDAEKLKQQNQAEAAAKVKPLKAKP